MILILRNTNHRGWKAIPEIDQFIFFWAPADKNRDRLRLQVLAVKYHCGLSTSAGAWGWL
jgi:hypothetical protein